MSQWSSNSRRWREKIVPAVLEAFNYECVVCGTSDDLTVDHIIPKSKGGTDDFENLRVMCRSHNAQKSAKVGPVVNEWVDKRWIE